MTCLWNIQVPVCVLCLLQGKPRERAEQQHRVGGGHCAFWTNTSSSCQILTSTSTPSHASHSTADGEHVYPNVLTHTEMPQVCIQMDMPSGVAMLWPTGHHLVFAGMVGGLNSWKDEWSVGRRTVKASWSPVVPPHLLLRQGLMRWHQVPWSQCSSLLNWSHRKQIVLVKAPVSEVWPWNVDCQIANTSSGSLTGFWCFC